MPVCRLEASRTSARACYKAAWSAWTLAFTAYGRASIVGRDSGVVLAGSWLIASPEWDGFTDVASRHFVKWTMAQRTVAP